MPSSEDYPLLRFAGFTIDVQRRGLYRGDERVHLTPTPFKVLAFLAQHRGSVVSKEELLNAVWGGHREENTVEQAVRQIRRALGEQEGSVQFIQTIPGVGYCFIAEIMLENGLVSEPDPFSPGPPAEATPARRSRAQAIIRRIALLSAIAICAEVLYTGALVWEPSRIQAVNPIRLTNSTSGVLSPLLADASQIAYPRYEEGRYTMAAMPVKGGEETPIGTNLSNPEICDVTPDGTAMLLRNLIHSRNDDEPLYIQTTGEEARRVGDILAYDAAWQPGKRRIFYSADGVVYSTDITGSSKRLFSVPGNAYWFRWSPDHKKLRFTVIDKKNEATSIWEVDAGSNRPHRLMPKLPYYKCCGTWTPDGRFFLFQARVDNTFQIWARREQSYSLSLRKSQPFPMIYGAVSYRGPLVSKDGKTLFLRAENPKGELERYDSKSREFVPLIPSISARTLDFSKDGNSIAYTTFIGGDLWQCHSDGKQCVQLTRDFRNTLMPRWSPDGRTIAFMGVHHTGNWGIYIVSATGGPTHCLISEKQSEGYPDWSPDGQHLVFSEVIPLAPPEGIHIVDLRTSKVSTLPGSNGFSLPRWSPDGRYIVAIHAGDQYPYLFDLATSTWRLLARLPAGYPSWSHDGKQVYFLSNVSGTRTVFRVAVADRRVEKVAALEAVDPSPSILGDWMGLMPNDAPLAVQDMMTDNIYSWTLVEK